MGLRLSIFFGNLHKFWINRQTEIDIREIREKMEEENTKMHQFGLID